MQQQEVVLHFTQDLLTFHGVDYGSLGEDLNGEVRNENEIVNLIYMLKLILEKRLHVNKSNSIYTIKD